jgi:DNA-binding transcriptional MocR family regulator
MANRAAMANSGQLAGNARPGAGDLAAALLPWLDGSSPLYERLSAGLRELIESGRLERGALLPPERALAPALSLSRSTVVAALEGLRRDGLVERRQGSGTRVLDVRRPRSVALRTAYRRPEGDAADVLNLSRYSPGVTGRVAAAVRAAADDLEGAELGPGYEPVGLPALRRAILAHQERWELRARDDEVLVTSGTQQALALIAALYLQPGDAVAVEDPTYVGALDAFTAAGARPIGVERDGDGPRPDALREAVTRSGARLAYLVPTGHNPSGSVATERRRAEIAAGLAELGVPLVEDDAFHDLTLRRRRPPTIAGLAGGATVLTLGSLSKLFWGGLRVGWVSGPAEVVERLARLKTLADYGSSLPAQLAGVRLLAASEAARDEARTGLAARARLVEEGVAELLPEWRWRAPAAGASSWARLAADATDFAAFARGFGVVVTPVATHSVSGRFGDRLRIGLTLPPDALREALARLARAWRAYDAPASAAGLSM